MRDNYFSCISIVILLNIVHFISVDSYILPNVEFKFLNQQGVLISIPDEPGLTFFAIHGNINKDIGLNQMGEISREIYRKDNEKWSIWDKDANLRVGDTLNYWFVVQVNGTEYKSHIERWIVTSEGAQDTKNSGSLVDELLFEESFNTLNKSIWSREIKLPLSPDYEFCIYHNEHHELLVNISDDKLRIMPGILEDYYGEGVTGYGTLTISDCTSELPEECSRKVVNFNIIPPTISVRLTTKNSFSFRYGKIEIRAKFPKGDWLYPEMWLRPKYNDYGTGYASGCVILGLARGNDNLVNATGSIFDSRRLDCGFRQGVSQNVGSYMVSKIRENGPKWTEDFHTYTTIWSSGGFQFLVDDEEIGKLTPGTNGWINGSNEMAPFNKEFYISLGVGVGGIRVFPDNTTSSNYAKPWENLHAKAMLKFWKARNNWLPSWKRQNNAFEIDYIRVWSLK
ncbi:beta-1,3-glucan-binding protein-like isoform X2 [Ceratina calcarata]|uniref:Beta-1,3-glucan-binding protein-like isoform X2 n=1 Tax=Ceratina calcarata TaxID=156304 RepID=A0AAJ7RVW0_9HYME|nr:beta-1,3-glucan-binding protein-like isoform X2 [Ceratina calcarata]